MWRHVVFLSRLAWPGAVLGSVLAALLFAAYTAAHLRSGLGVVVDLLAIVLLTPLAMAGLAGVLVLLRLGLRWLPVSFAAGILAPFAIVFALLMVFESGFGVGLRVAGVLIVLSAALGGAVALVTRRTRDLNRGRRAAAWTLLVVAFGAWVALVAWVYRPGSDPSLDLVGPSSVGAVAPLQVEDPSRRGPHTVRTLFYGSGTDRRRSEYGSQITLRTEPVDASRLLTQLRGVKARLRAWYWGFGADRLPINGRVWHPEGDGPFPLVLVVHGNHRMEHSSDPGYAYLGERLASRGFVVVSVDENFLNRSWSGDIGSEHGVRGWLLLQHLATWRRWNETPGHPFHRRIDMERIALIGHSRGGEAVTHAAAFNRLRCLPDDCTVTFDFGFSIRALIALAPTDGGYEPADQLVPIGNVSYLVIHGSHDGDVPNFEGLRAYRRVRLTDERYRFKAALHVYRANHDQFNTVWSDEDIGPPFSGLALRKSVLRGVEQRRIAEVFIGGFLEAALRDREEYVPMFRDVRSVTAWLPRTTYVSRFEDSTYRKVTDFSGIDLGRGTLDGSIQAGQNLAQWQEGDFKGRGTWPFRLRVLYLGWGGTGVDPTRPASYRITLPDGTASAWRLDATSRLAIGAADTRDPDTTIDASGKREPIDFTVELVTAEGVVARVPLSRIFPLPLVPRVRFTKWAYLDRAFYPGESEPVFQTYELPLELFAASGWEPTRLREIRFVFDRTRSGTIAIDGVGFSRPPDAPRP